MAAQLLKEINWPKNVSGSNKLDFMNIYNACLSHFMVTCMIHDSVIICSCK